MTANTASDSIRQIEAAMTVKRVYGEPFESKGVGILPVARVAAGAGAGGGAGDAEGNGWGGGFGVVSQPLGVYVIDEAGVHWVPAGPADHLISAIVRPRELLRGLLLGAASKAPPPVRTAIRAGLSDEGRGSSRCRPGH